MHSKVKYSQTACSKENFPMLHSIRFTDTLLHSCLLSKTAGIDFIESKTKQTIKRIESLTAGQIQAMIYNLSTCVGGNLLITAMLAYTVLGRFQSL
jgi:hypothetical protein